MECGNENLYFLLYVELIDAKFYRLIIRQEWYF